MLVTAIVGLVTIAALAGVLVAILCYAVVLEGRADDDYREMRLNLAADYDRRQRALATANKAGRKL